VGVQNLLDQSVEAMFHIEIILDIFTICKYLTFSPCASNSSRPGFTNYFLSFGKINVRCRVIGDSFVVVYNGMQIFACGSSFGNILFFV
jgi:hypothetical protein